MSCNIDMSKIQQEINMYNRNVLLIKLYSKYRLVISVYTLYEKVHNLNAENL